MCLDFKNIQSFSNQNLNCKILSKTTIGQTLANQLRIILRSSTCIIISKRKKAFCTSYKHYCNQETIRLLACENLEHKGEGSQGVFKGCKEFTKIVENLKWVA